MQSRVQAERFGIFRVAFVCVALPVVGLIVPMGSAVAQDATNVYRTAAGSVFTVEAVLPNGKSQGSAVAVSGGPDPEGGLSKTEWLATNQHVVRENKFVTVRQGMYNSRGEVIYSDETIDLALIRVQGGVFSAPQTRPIEDVEIGQRTFAIGSPFGLESSITEGIVSGKRTIDGVRLIQSTASISPGNSGGGLFDSQARLLGITTFKFRGGENLNFSLEVGVIKDIHGAMWARDFMKAASALTESARDAIFDSKFVTWLATSYDKGSKRYLVVLDLLYRMNNKLIDPEVAMTQLNEFMVSYSEASRRAASETSSQGTVVLDCDLDFRSSGRRSQQLQVDFDRKLVNGKPAEISTEAIVIGAGTSRLEINRSSGLVTALISGTPNRVGECQRAMARRF